MKKVFSVLTVAVLAVSTVFAGFGGSASIGFGANLDNGNYGFLDQSNGVVLDVDLSTADGEAVGEGEVYASIKGSMGLYFLGGFGSVDHGVFDGSVSYDEEAAQAAMDAYQVALDAWEAAGSIEADKPEEPDMNDFIVSSNAMWGVNAAVTEAKIGGANWSVSILGMPGNPDYAKSAIDSGFFWTTDDWGRDLYYPSFPAYSYAAPYAKTNGVTVEVAGYKAGLGIMGDFAKKDADKLVDFSAFVETPEYDFNGFTVQAGATYALNQVAQDADGNVVPKFDPEDKDVNALGISAKTGYANDKLSFSLAADMGVDFLEATKDEDKFNADVAANFKYDFVSVDAYYATVAGAKKSNTLDNLLSTQVKLDLNSFDVPVALTVAAKDLIAKQDLSVKAVVSPLEGLKLTLKGGYVIDNFGRTKSGAIVEAKHDNVGKWSTGVSAEYKHELFTAKAGFDLEQIVKEGEKVLFGAKASIESDSIIPGATIGLAWDGAKDLLDTNPKKDNFGTLMATCTIEF